MGNPMIEAAVCPLCGMGWCGRPCLRDPRKSNALLFHPSGREKTLKERGLSLDDPPPKMLTVQMRKPKLLPAPKAVTEKPVTKPPAVTKPPKGGRPRRGEQTMTAAERARQYRERKAKDKPQDFKG